MKTENIAEFKKRLKLVLRKDAFKKGTFVLSSGKTSNYYLDGRIVTLSPQGAYLCASIILDRIKDLNIDAVGGPTLGADPIVGAIAVLSHINKLLITTFIVRKAAKGHGTQQQIEGPKLNPLSKVVLVDDVATTGKALIEAKEVLDKLGVVVEKAIVIVDRLEGAKENLEKIGCPLESIFTIKDLDR